jgi:hypothetical protein
MATIPHVQVGAVGNRLHIVLFIVINLMYAMLAMYAIVGFTVNTGTCRCTMLHSKDVECYMSQ